MTGTVMHLRSILITACTQTTNRRRRDGRRPRGRRLAGSFESLEPRQLLAIDVTNLDDSGPGSLRAAIETINAAKISDTIVFKNLGAGTIAVASSLPALTNPAGTTFAFGGTTSAITLDGGGLRGDGLAIGDGVKNVSMSGIKLTIQNFTLGLVLSGSCTGSTFRGLTLTGNDTGLSVAGGDYSGTVISGNALKNNRVSGLGLGGDSKPVTKLTIGGLALGAGNRISSNTMAGLFFEDGDYSGTVVQGNLITSNRDSGVVLGTSGIGVRGLTLGGNMPAATNTIAFNKDSGVFVGGGSYAKTFIQGNNIASNATFGIELGASEGDFVGTLSDLTIGGSGSGEGNTIASNAYDGIGIIGRVLLGSNYGGTRVQGNTIRFNFANGVNINRMAFGAGFTGLLLGGGPGEGNTITNNGHDGVQVNAGIYAFTTVEGNTIASNARNGVNFYAPYGQRLTGLGLGGTGAGKGNTINDNAGSGLAASKGNYALTTVAGNTFRGNRIGISLIDTKNLTIGGPLAAATNMVGDNTDAGLAATGDLTGTQVLGNAFTSTRGSSVSLADVSGLIFGQTVPGAGNTLSGGEVGLVATGMMGGTSVMGNTFTGQSVGIRLQNASGDSSDKPFLIGGATDAVGDGAGNVIHAVSVGLYATGNLTQTFISGNRITASGSGGNAMLLDNATQLTVGGTLARQGNTLSAPQGNALSATGDLSGTVFYRNTATASQYGALLTRARNFLFGNRSSMELGNLVQSNRVGVRAVGNSRGSQVCGTKWSNNRIRLQRANARQLVVQPRVR